MEQQTTKTQNKIQEIIQELKKDWKTPTLKLLIGILQGAFVGYAILLMLTANEICTYETLTGETYTKSYYEIGTQHLEILGGKPMVLVDETFMYKNNFIIQQQLHNKYPIKYLYCKWGTDTTKPVTKQEAQK